VGKQRNKKYILNLSMELVKVDGYDFPHPFDGSRNSHLFFKRPLGDIQFDMSDIDPSLYNSIPKPIVSRNTGMYLFSVFHRNTSLLGFNAV
jgi:hypothetical protein